MSDAKPSTEAMDVLSSIRRLVSENRRVERVEPVPPAPPAESVPGQSLAASARFVLTAAHRVDDETDEELLSDAGDGVPADEPRAPVFAAEEAVPAIAASLEDAIAELEQAVAGLDAPFESDGADPEALEVEPLPPFDPAPWRSEHGAERPISAFRGIIAGFDGTDTATGPVDEPLDMPVTAEMPPVVRDDDAVMNWRLGSASLPRLARDVPHDLPVEPALTAAEHPDPTGTADEAAAGPAGAVESLGGAAAEILSAATPDVDGDAAALPGEEEPAVMPTSEERADTAVAEVLVLTGAADSSAEPAEDADAPQGRLHLGHHRPGGKPTIVRPSFGDDDQGFGVSESDASDSDEEESDLFNPLASADLDIEALRDMVTEIIREELRGTLGERITRNLRTLVRREIARALADGEVPDGR